MTEWETIKNGLEQRHSEVVKACGTDDPDDPAVEGARDRGPVLEACCKYVDFATHKAGETLREEIKARANHYWRLIQTSEIQGLIKKMADAFETIFRTVLEKADPETLARETHLMPLPAYPCCWSDHPASQLPRVIGDLVHHPRTQTEQETQALSPPIRNVVLLPNRSWGEGLLSNLIKVRWLAEQGLFRPLLRWSDDAIKFLPSESLYDRIPDRVPGDPGFWFDCWGVPRWWVSLLIPHNLGVLPEELCPTEAAEYAECYGRLVRRLEKDWERNGGLAWFKLLHIYQRHELDADLSLLEPPMTAEELKWDKEIAESAADLGADGPREILKALNEAHHPLVEWMGQQAGVQETGTAIAVPDADPPADENVATEASYNGVPLWIAEVRDWPAGGMGEDELYELVRKHLRPVIDQREEWYLQDHPDLEREEAGKQFRRATVEIYDNHMRLCQRVMCALASGKMPSRADIEAMAEFMNRKVHSRFEPVVGQNGEPVGVREWKGTLASIPGPGKPFDLGMLREHLDAQVLVIYASLAELLTRQTGPQMELAPVGAINQLRTELAEYRAEVQQLAIGQATNRREDGDGIQNPLGLEIPVNVRWDDVEITLYSNTECRIKVSDAKPKRCTMSQMRMHDGRKGDAEGKLWRVLKAFCTFDGKISKGKLHEDDQKALSKTIQRLNNHLKELLPLSGRAVSKYVRKGKCYHSNFKAKMAYSLDNDGESNSEKPDIP